MRRVAVGWMAILLGFGLLLSALPQRGGQFGPPPPGGPGPGRGGRGPGGLGAVTVPADDPLTPEKVALGRKLFFDTGLSRNRTVSCATCHQPEHGYADGRRVAVGVDHAQGTRNTPTLINIGSAHSYFWDGRAATLEEQVLGPIVNPIEMGLSADQIEARTSHAAAEVTSALASYVRTIRAGVSRYDWYLAGQTQVLTADERAGLDLFRGKARCITCHGGPNLSDDRFHNTGVSWDGSKFTDEGRFAVSGFEPDHGAFKTPTLRNIALTAPYMHDGSQATLEDVVAFYDQGGRRNPSLDFRMHPLHLTTEEQRDLVAFLKTLTGPVSEGLN